MSDIHPIDYVVFFVVIAICIGIGIYFSLSGGKQSTTGEYLLGDRKMGLIPVTLSLTVSWVSTITMLGLPAEMYSYGTQYWLSCIGIIIASTAATYIFIPIFYYCDIASVNEYLEMRFQSRWIKYIGSFCGIVAMLFYISNVIFGPATAIEAVSGIPVWVPLVVLNLAAVIYTTLGGFKAVIWTDVFQSLIMLAGLIAVCWQCGNEVKALGANVGDTLSAWGRNNLWDFDPNPFKRVNFWGIIFGVAVTEMGVYGYYQVAVQRFCSLPTINKARLSVLIAGPGTGIYKSLACVAGILLFTYYTSLGCDPYANGEISNPNQVLPYFIRKVFNYPFIPGLFLASMAGGSLSSASSAINAAAANAWRDIGRDIWPNLSDFKQTTITKLLVCIFGGISLLMSFGIKDIGGPIEQIIFTFSGGLTGPLCGLFLLGAFFPFVSWQGALSGTIGGIAFGLWMAFGAYDVDGNWVGKPTITTNCTNNATDLMGFNETITAAPVDQYFDAIKNPHGLDRLYSVSFLWYNPLVAGITMFVASVISLIFGRRKVDTINPKFLHPLIRSFCDLDQEEWDAAHGEKSGKVNYAMDQEDGYKDGYKNDVHFNKWDGTKDSGPKYDINKEGNRDSTRL